ncbi:MAG: RNA 2',3'-cyclic phosphodiesterase [Anaerolineae bacterium]|nr:RNA 2',3'-cyclic phosphodiesterase [Anaerolineae bacterium]
MNAIRAFIAIELPQPIQSRLGEIIQELKSSTPKALRWVPPGNIHLTLKFLGNVSPTNLTSLNQALSKTVSRHRSFEFSVAGFGAFPNKLRPRVVWVGVAAPEELELLHHNIDRETERLGYHSEDRNFSPHLTLGRVSQHASPVEVKQIADVLNGYQVGELGKVNVKSVHLYRSDLQPGGAVYSPLFKAPLE